MRSLRGGGKEKAPPYPESTRGDGHRGSTLIYHSRRPTDAGPDGGIVPRAPGRTSRPSPQTRFQPTAGPLCPGRGTVTLSDPHPRHRPQPIHSSILAGNAFGVKGGKLNKMIILHQEFTIDFRRKWSLGENLHPPNVRNSIRRHRISRFIAIVISNCGMSNFMAV